MFPRPEVFNPFRWAAPTKAMKEWLMPFGGGSRSKYIPLCIYYTEADSTPPYMFQA